MLFRTALLLTTLLSALSYSPAYANVTVDKMIVELKKGECPWDKWVQYELFKIPWPTFRALVAQYQNMPNSERYFRRLKPGPLAIPILVTTPKPDVQNVRKKENEAVTTKRHAIQPTDQMSLEQLQRLLAIALEFRAIALELKAMNYKRPARQTASHITAPPYSLPPRAFRAVAVIVFISAVAMALSYFRRPHRRFG